jgi:hypothetical protein
MKGPGGYYNVGNVVGLCTGIGLQILAVSGSGGDASISAALRDHFIGSPGAAALSGAMVTFLASGECYHRARLHGSPPHDSMNRAGDLLSGFGALALSVALVAFGQPLLALTSGILLAGGKFGSFFAQNEYAPRGPGRSAWPDRFRTAVLVSRVPAIMAVLAELAMVLYNFGPATPAAAVIAPLSLFLCYLLWTRADLLLFGAAAGAE